MKLHEVTTEFSRCTKCGRYFIPDFLASDGFVIEGHPMLVLVEEYELPNPPPDAAPFVCDMDDCSQAQST